MSLGNLVKDGPPRTAFVHVTEEATAGGGSCGLCLLQDWRVSVPFFQVCPSAFPPKCPVPAWDKKQQC